ncbi:MAG: DUF5996 family protein [Longimicrobiales bacterium]
MSTSAAWPALPYDDWKDTLATLHLWTQIVGKVRLERTPWINHSWHVPLYVTARGLSTSAIPAGGRVFEMEFDFRRQLLDIAASDGAGATIALEPRTVADFHGEVMARLDEMGLATPIHTVPSEIPDGIPFEQDREHEAYDGEAARRFWKALVSLQRVFQRFRARFVGKSSPVHFFWGSFDLAVTRFSGRPAPEHPAGIPAMPDWVAREAYSHEVSSLGFWPGGESHPHPIVYAYAYPTPAGFAEASPRPEAAVWVGDLGEYVLPWEAVRTAPDPAADLLAFAQDTYEAAADLAGWDREALEWPEGAQGPPETV